MLQRFLHYFEDTWLNNPNYPLDYWCVFNRDDLTRRTNNDLEGCHRYLNQFSFGIYVNPFKMENKIFNIYSLYLKFFRHHRDLWTFLKSLQKLQDSKELEYLRFRLGWQVPSIRRRADRNKESELLRLRTTFIRSNRSVENAYEYVWAVSFNMRQYKLGPDDNENIIGWQD